MLMISMPKQGWISVPPPGPLLGGGTKIESITDYNRILFCPTTFLETFVLALPLPKFTPATKDLYCRIFIGYSYGNITIQSSGVDMKIAAI